MFFFFWRLFAQGFMLNIYCAANLVLGSDNRNHFKKKMKIVNVFLRGKSNGTRQPSRVEFWSQPLALHLRAAVHGERRETDKLRQTLFFFFFFAYALVIE